MNKPTPPFNLPATTPELALRLGLVLAGLVGLMWLGSGLIDFLKSMLADSLSIDAKQLVAPERMLAQLHAQSLHTLLAFLPFLALMTVLAIVPPLLMHGWLFTWEPLTPKFSKLNPLSGLQRMFSLTSLVEMAKAVQAAST